MKISMDRYPGVLLLLALVCSWGTLYLLSVGAAWLAIPTAAAALFSMIDAFRLAPLPVATVSDDVGTAMAVRTRYGLRALLLAALLAIGTAVHFYRDPYIDWSLLLYPLALLLAWYGEGRLRGQGLGRQLRALGASIRQRRVELALLAIVTCASLVLRFWIILQYPLLHGMQTDEVDTALSAWNLAHSTGPWPLYQISTGAVSFFQPISASFALFGTSLLSLRIPLVIEGTMLVPAFYVFARQFVGVAPGLCAATLLGFAYWPVMLSLFAFGWMNGAVFQALGLGLLAYAVRRGRFTAAAAGGAVLALCLYCYGVSRLLPLPAIVLLAPFVIRGVRPPRDRLRLLVAFGLGFLMVAAPFASTVISNTDLLYGNGNIDAHDFEVALKHNPLTALAGLLDPAGRLMDTVLAAPRMDSGYAAVRISHNGLLDALTAMLVLLGLLYAVVYWRRPQNLLIVPALLISFGVASAVQGYWLDTYRLGGAVPALFLAAACVLDRGFAVIRLTWRSMRWALAALLAISVAGAGANIHRVAAQLTDCSVLAAQFQVLSQETDEGVLIAEKVNALGPHRAYFLVSHSFQNWLYTWLYHVPPPVEYDAASGPANNPALWQPLGPVVRTTGPGSARFWPPAAGSGQTAITYIVPDGDRGYFLPLVQREYPHGELQTLQNSVCPAFKTTFYTLTTQQIARGRT
ncbi:MAG: hypothetical protein JWO42_2602 [Chloroflexi bacterium]|nr:hypothetical protein [Chloroflexota bacterium]